MRWLGGIGGAKCGGGWYDPYGTTEATYVEQARQTVLGGARESMLFCYGSLQERHGSEATSKPCAANIPELLAVAERGAPSARPWASPPTSRPTATRKRSHACSTSSACSGFPLVPCHEFPSNAPAGFFSVHALKDPELSAKLSSFIAAGKPTLVTDGLAKRLGDQVDLSRSNVQILPVQGDPKSLLEIPQEQLDKTRQPLLQPFATTLRAPNRVALYLFDDGSWVIENFNGELASVDLHGKTFEIEAQGLEILVGAVSACALHEESV